MKKISSTVNMYRSGNAYFTCDRCSQRWRRAQMLTEWTNLKVCPVCIDPRPPQMMPPNIYPEGIPFMDARAPQDNPTMLSDDSYLVPVTGGMIVSNGVVTPNVPIGAMSPQAVIETDPDFVPGPNVLADDIEIKTGPIAAPSVGQGGQ